MPTDALTYAALAIAILHMQNNNARWTAAASRLDWVWVGLIVIVAATMALQGPPLVDEWSHQSLIRYWLDGTPSPLADMVSTLPGYHIAVAQWVRVSGLGSLAALRMLTLVFGSAAVLLFALIWRRWQSDSWLMSAQFAVLPLVLPFAVLVYTDVPSLFVVLLGVWLLVSGHVAWAGLALCAAVLVRQNNVVWSAFYVVVAWQAAAAMPVRTRLRGLWPLALPSLLFIAHWVHNGSINNSASESVLHPDLRLSIGNPLFFIFLLATLMPLHTLRAVVLALNRERWRLWLAPAVAIVVFALWFRVDHPYNQGMPEYFLRNQWLLNVVSHWPAKIVFAMLIAGGTLLLTTTPLIGMNSGVFLLLVMPFLAASWLIEQRYAIVPMSLWLLLRQPSAEWIERSTLYYWGSISLILVMGMHTHRFFP